MIAFLSIYLAILNVAGFAVAARDKRAAVKKSRRTAEKTFVLLAWSGGGIGVLAAFYLLRHKTKHGVLLSRVWSAAIFSTAVFGLVFWYMVNPF